MSGTGQAIANHQKIARNNRTFIQMAKAPDTPGPEREFSLFDGPGGAMGIDFFVDVGTYFSRVSAKKNCWVFFGCFLGVFVVFGGCFCAFGCFLFLFRALARIFFFFFFGGAVSKTGNSRSVGGSSDEGQKPAPPPKRPNERVVGIRHLAARGEVALRAPDPRSAHLPCTASTQ